MNDANSQLDRLFRAARAATPPEAAPLPVPGHVKTRVLAHWRADWNRESGWLSIASLFPRALACATIAMLLCLIWSYTGYTDPAVTDFASDQSDDAPAAYELSDPMPGDPMP